MLCCMRCSFWSMDAKVPAPVEEAWPAEEARRRRRHVRRRRGGGGGGMACEGGGVACGKTLCRHYVWGRKLMINDKTVFSLGCIGWRSQPSFRQNKQDTLNFREIGGFFPGGRTFFPGG